MTPGSFSRLVGFECRKAFINPWMLVFFAALLLLNGWKLGDAYDRKVSRWQDYETQYFETYDACQGIITPEKAGKLMAVYSPLEEKYNAWALNYEYDPRAYTYSEGMDEEFYRTLFVTEMRYDYLYQNEAHRISSNAAELSLLYRQQGNSYESRKNRQIAEDFAGRQISSFSDTRGYEVLLEYDFSSMLILLLNIFALCRVFVRERETDMYMLLQTTRHGTAATVAAKLTASLLFTIAVCAVFFSQDFLGIYLASNRNEALQSPVYALRALEVTPLCMHIGAYFFYAAAVKALGMLGCAAVILLISSLLRQTLGAFLASLAALSFFTVLQECSGCTWSLKWFNPIELLICRELIATDTFVNVCSMPVRAIHFVLLGTTVSMSLAAWGILQCSRRYHSRAERRTGHVSL